MIDIVIPLLYEASHWENNELRYCLRSLQENFKGYFNIVLVTNKAPDWLRNVDIIEMPRWFPDSQNRPYRSYEMFFDTIHKLDVIANNIEISNDFIYCYDDIILLNEIDNSFFNNKTALCHISCFNHKGRWSDTLIRSASYDMRNFYVYEHHFPVLLNRGILQKMFLDFPYHKLKYPYAPISKYFNIVSDKPDIVLAEGNNIICYNNIEDGKIWLNYNDSGLNKVKEQIMSKFPNKSVYEKS